ncbi:acyl carrier protein [Kitasatospora sp. NPDC094019]|uniref:acyl carrier protein n=1 Tax=Kitasatospora sp. NPDC094019 TaxID=3364091 RepID=UPI003813148C
MNAARTHLIELLAERFDAAPDAIGDGTTLGDLDLDSLSRIELIVMLQEHWGIALDEDEDSTAEVTVGRLSDRITELTTGPADRPVTPGTPAPPGTSG